MIFGTMHLGEINCVPAERVGQGEVDGFSIEWEVHGIACGWHRVGHSLLLFFAHADLENSPLTSHKASISGTVGHIFSAKVFAG